jgi:alpha-D-ribose 1-methylphosphonate 5-triphosphate synthase subunit PhnI
MMGIYHNVSKEYLHRNLGQWDFCWNDRQMIDGERTLAAILSANGKRLIQVAKGHIGHEASARRAAMAILMAKQGQANFTLFLVTLRLYYGTYRRFHCLRPVDVSPKLVYSKCSIYYTQIY